MSGPPELLYRFQARDHADAGYGVYALEDIQTVLAASINARFAVPPGYVLILQTCTVRTVVGAGQTGTFKAISVVDKGGTTSRAVLAYAQTSIGGGTTQRENLLNHEGLWIPGDLYDVLVTNTFDAGVNANTSAVGVFGLVIPRGSMRG